MSSEERRHRKIDDLTLKDKSDEELRKEISRMRLEKEYRELSRSNVINGSKYVNSLLLSSGTIALTTLMTTLSGGVGAGVGQKFVKFIIGKGK